MMKKLLHSFCSSFFVRPRTEAACTQRADTSVGPYRGSKGDLYFGGVANHDCVHGRGMPRPYKGTRRSPHTRKERHLALRLVY